METKITGFLFLLFFLLAVSVNCAEKSKDIDSYLIIDGGKIYYDDGGSGGIPIIFIHGLGGDHTLFKCQLDHFRKNRRAIAVDLFGHYKSTPLSESGYSIHYLAESLIEFTNCLKIEKFILAGHSLGAAIITEAAYQTPEKVAALIFIDPAGNTNKMSKETKDKMIQSLKSPDYRDFMKAWFLSVLNSAKDETKKPVMEALGKVSQNTLLGEYGALTEYDPVTALNAYSGPMLSINRPESTGHLSYHKLVPKIESVTLEGVSHWFMLDDPEQVNRIIDDFLKKVLK